MIYTIFRDWLVFLPNIPTILLALVQSSYKQQEILRTMHTEQLAMLSTIHTLVLSLVEDTQVMRGYQQEHTNALISDKEHRDNVLLSTKDHYTTSLAGTRLHIEEMDSELRYLQKTIRTMSTDVHTTLVALHTIEEKARTIRLL